MSTKAACMPGSTRSTRPFTTLPTTLRPLSRSMWSSTNCFFSRIATRVSPSVALIRISFCMPALRPASAQRGAREASTRPSETGNQGAGPPGMAGRGQAGAGAPGRRHGETGALEDVPIDRPLCSSNTFEDLQVFRSAAPCPSAPRYPAADQRLGPLDHPYLSPAHCLESRPLGVQGRTERKVVRNILDRPALVKPTRDEAMTFPVGPAPLANGWTR